jgi:hypothetical protein
LPQGPGDPLLTAAERQQTFAGSHTGGAAAAAKERGWPPLHHKTATNYLNNLSALFNWAVEEGHVEKNPARALKVAAPPGSGKSRLPFSTEQLNRIFHAPLYVAGEGDIEKRKGRFWVPVLSLCELDPGNETGS